MGVFYPGMLLTAERLNPDGPHAWSPTLTATDANPALGSEGDFIRDGVWSRIGNVVVVSVRLRFGSSGTSAGSGFYRISLPVPASAAYPVTGGIGVGPQCGVATLRRQSPFQAVVGSVQLTNLTNVQINIPGSVGTVRESAPWTWASGDAISLSAAYLIDL